MPYKSEKIPIAGTKLDRRAYGFEVNKEFFKGAQDIITKCVHKSLFTFM